MSTLTISPNRHHIACSLVVNATVGCITDTGRPICQIQAYVMKTEEIVKHSSGVLPKKQTSGLTSTRQGPYQILVLSSRMKVL